MKAFSHYFLYELKAGVRDRSQLFMNWLFPLLVFVMMATVMGGINPAFKAQMLPAMMLFGMMSTGLLSLPAAWINLREAGVFRSYRINRVSALAILAAPVLASLVHMAGVSAIIAIVGINCFGGAVPGNWLAFVAGWTASSLAVCGLGMVIGTLLPNPRAGMLVSQLFYLPSIMLGGLMFPSSLLPPSLGRVARLLPAHWSMEAMTSSRSPIALTVLRPDGVWAEDLRTEFRARATPDASRLSLCMTGEATASAVCRRKTATFKTTHRR